MGRKESNQTKQTKKKIFTLFIFTALLHLYYARFFNHFLCDIGIVKHREPFVNLLTQGMVKGKSYRVKKTGQYLHRDQVDFSGMYNCSTTKGSDSVVTGFPQALEIMDNH